MIYKGDLNLMYNQLTTLRKDFPNIIYNVVRNERCDYASATIIEKGFVSIGYRKRPCMGFFVSIDSEDVLYFADKTFRTAEEAFGELSVWMNKYGYRYKKYDTPKEYVTCSVTREPIHSS